MSISLDRFRAETEVTDADAARVVMRARTRKRAWGRWVVLAGLGIGVAAYAQILRPPAEATFDGPFDGRTRGGSHLVGDGRAHVSGEAVELASGALTATDGRFVLRTREAEVRGVNAAVHLQRDVLGTHVVVQRGDVTVRCGDQEPLATASSCLCLPTSGEGMLARAASLPIAERADALDAAVRLATSPTTRAEALFQRGMSRVADPDAALPDLEAAEATGASVRPDDLARALGRLYAAANRCDDALPRLRSLRVLGDDAALLARCEKTATPD